MHEIFCKPGIDTYKTDITFLAKFVEIASCLPPFPCLAAAMRSIPSDLTPGA